MKKLLYVVIVLFIILGLEIGYTKLNKRKTTVIPTNIPVPVKKEIQVKKTLFVPSWNLKEADIYNEYDRLFYFGVGVTEKGINKYDEGYENIDGFNRSGTNGIKKYLVLKMIDSNINQEILSDEKIQSTIVNQIMELVKEKGFHGLALDLEISTLFNEVITKEINVFVQKMYTGAKNYYIPFTVILYGDGFYRKRPFDVDTISRNSDEIMVMAYDFHKSVGEPGPNFPLSKGRLYQYDFKAMIQDYLIFVKPEKLTIIYGMYGYEWIVDEKRRPIRPAKALTLKEIKKNFIDKCEWQDCLVIRDPNSFETEVNFIQSAIIDTYAAMNMHIVWFEDEESVRMKTEFLKEKGISNTAFWVAGYF